MIQKEKMSNYCWVNVVDDDDDVCSSLNRQKLGIVLKKLDILTCVATS